MTMPGFKYYNRKEWISISSAKDFLRCDRRYFYKSGCDLYVDGPSHPALSFGSGTHAGLPYALQGDVARAMVEFEKCWGDTEGDTKRNIRTAKGLFMDFAMKHAGGKSLYSLIKPPKSPLSKGDSNEYEIPFAIDIGMDIPFYGKIDGCGKHRDTGELWAIEFKTTSQLSTWFFNSIVNNPQCVSYAFALSLVTGEEVRGTILDAMLVAKDKRDSQGIPQYVTEFQIKAMLNSLRYVVARIRACEKAEDFPQNFFGCSTMASFGLPGSPCEYAQLCSVEDWTSIKDLYVVKERQQLLKPTIEGK